MTEQGPIVLSDRTPGRLGGPPAPGFGPYPFEEEPRLTQAPCRPSSSSSRWVLWFGYYRAFVPQPPRSSRDRQLNLAEALRPESPLPRYRPDLKPTSAGQPGASHAPLPLFRQPRRLVAGHCVVYHNRDVNISMGRVRIGRRPRRRHVFVRGDTRWEKRRCTARLRSNFGPQQPTLWTCHTVHT